MKYNPKARNYYNLNIEKVLQVYKDQKPTHIGDIVVVKGKDPVALFHVKHYNKAKGHKEYFGLTRDGSNVYITGHSRKDVEKAKWHTGIMCLKCNEIVVSLARHDYIICGCPNHAMMDGGQDKYFRYGCLNLIDISPVQVNMITGTVKKYRESK